MEIVVSHEDILRAVFGFCVLFVLIACCGVRKLPNCPICNSPDTDSEMDGWYKCRNCGSPFHDCEP